MDLSVLNPFNSVLTAGLAIINKLIPDEAERARLELELFKQHQAGELAEMTTQLEQMRAQTDINKAEATHSSLFVSGWRPAVGWVCAAALAYQYLIRPFLVGLFGFAAMPGLDDTLWGLLFGLLGLGGFRTVEKIKGVTK